MAKSSCSDPEVDGPFWPALAVSLTQGLQAQTLVSKMINFFNNESKTLEIFHLSL